MTASLGPLPDRAFHMVDAENWPAIQRHGLYSTTALIERAGLTGAAARPFAEWRATGMDLPSGAQIRDQAPMPPAALARCLDPGLTPQAWYDLVNAKVFFWLDQDRLARHIGACRGRPQIVVTVDLHSLLARHGDRAFLTPFNTGNARRAAAARGHRTFVPLATWLDSRWESESGGKRARSHPPAELAIEGSVPDVLEFTVERQAV